MPFLITNPFQFKAQCTQNKKYGAWLVGLSAFFSFSSFANSLTPYHAEYQILRKGSVQGSATRQLSKIDENTFQLKYQSDINWMIFNDKRKETSMFTFADDRAQPIHYDMTRSGTGPDKEYTVSFDHTQKKITTNKQKYPLDIAWQSNQQDAQTYQIQLRQDIKSGKTKLSYPIVDKKGNQRNYNFAIEGYETITLPIGNVKTIKIKRLYDNNKRQATVWLAPEYDYMLVKMYKGKEGIEQFQVHMTKYEFK
jgi:hypothetical protein